MTRPTRISFLISVVTILCLGLVGAAPAMEHEGTNQAEAPGATATSAEQDRDPVARQLFERRQALLEEARTALDETNAALIALGEGEKEAALAALATVTGRLELLVARDPSLGLAPVEMSVVTHDLYASPEALREARREAEQQLEAGRVQEARALLAGMGSETVISVTNLPLASYPDAIKAVSPLIDAGKTREAQAALRAALNTLVVTRQVIPLPPVRARAMIEEAQRLAESAASGEEPASPDRAAQVDALIEGAKQQIEMASLLGYGWEADHERLRSQIRELETKLGRSEETGGIFARLQASLDELQASMRQ